MEENSKNLQINFSGSTSRGGYKYRVNNYSTGNSERAYTATDIEDVTVAFDNYTQDRVEIYRQSYRPDAKDIFMIEPDAGLTSRVPLSDLISISGSTKTIEASGDVDFVLHIRPTDEEKDVHDVLSDNPIEIILEVDGVNIDSEYIPRQI
jgi:hypothetical protein